MKWDAGEEVGREGHSTAEPIREVGPGVKMGGQSGDVERESLRAYRWEKEKQTVTETVSIIGILIF